MGVLARVSCDIFTRVLIVRMGKLLLHARTYDLWMPTSDLGLFLRARPHAF